MALIIKRNVTPCDSEEVIIPIINNLKDKGFVPLILQAKKNYFAVFGEDVPYKHISHDTSWDPSSAMGAGAWFFSFKSKQKIRTPVIGDVFYTTGNKGIIYILIFRINKPEIYLQLEIGYIGDEKEVDFLTNFSSFVEDSLKKQDNVVEWSNFQQFNAQFEELRKDEDQFIIASSISSKDIELATIIENQTKRDIAFIIKRSGGILLDDLIKKFNTPEDTRKSIEELTKINLFKKEYVIICRKTSKQISRVETRDVINKMAEMKVLCPCGNSILNERIEELFSPTSELHKILDKSYWMTALLVKTLRQLDISNESILLNLREGTEEIDAFVDIEGTILMFELTDNEFSMGHAYPFSGRIGIYKPSYAIIVSTKGVAPEVKSYFEKVKPETTIVYIDHIDETNSSLKQIISEIRSKQAVEILSYFDDILTVQTKAANIIYLKG